MANATLTQWLLTAETREWVGPIVVTADGQAQNTFLVSLTRGSDRPLVWTPAYPLDSGLGVLVGDGTDWPLSVGVFTVWVKFTDVPEAPVLRVGSLKVS